MYLPRCSQNTLEIYFHRHNTHVRLRCRLRRCANNTGYPSFLFTVCPKELVCRVQQKRIYRRLYFNIFKTLPKDISVTLGKDNPADFEDWHRLQQQISDFRLEALWKQFATFSVSLLTILHKETQESQSLTAVYVPPFNAKCVLGHTRWLEHHMPTC